MATAVVTPAVGFYARTNIPKGDTQFPWVNVQIKRQNPIPVEGATAYFLRYKKDGKRHIIPLGKNLDEAFIAWQNHVSDMERIAAGRAPIHQDEPLPGRAVPDGRVTIADAVQTFINENLDAQAKGKLADSSVLAYNNAAIGFRDQAAVRFMDEVTREVLLAHETYLHTTLQKRAYGKKQTTIANRFRYLGIFFGRNGIKMVKDRRQIPGDLGLLRFDEAPKQPKKGRNGNAAPDMYSLEEINKMLVVATEDEKDLIQFFLRLGVRDEEAQYAEWTDIEATRDENGVIAYDFHAQEKPKYHWTLKDKEDRVIPIEDKLYKRLMARREKQVPRNDLIFPNSNGTPDANLIRRLQAASERAGLTKRPTLHKFRRTFASLMIAKSDLQTVQELLGHSDIETTALYLAPDQVKARKATRTVFAGVGD